MPVAVRRVWHYRWVTGPGRARSAPERLRVLVDATELGGPSVFRGIGTYLRNVLAGLAAEPELEVHALVQDGAELPFGVVAVPFRTRLPARVAWREREVRLRLAIDRAHRRLGVELFFAPATHLPRRSSVPVVATLHDVVPLVAQGYELEVPRWQRLAGRYRQAAVVVAVSAYSGAEGVRTLGLDPARVSVAHLGVSPAFSPGPSGEEGDYLLVVGEYDPRKRHALAVEVLDRLLPELPALELRIVGTVAQDYTAAWEQVLASASCPDRVRVLGRVSAERLLDLYRGARALQVLSSIEGFGLPALEAMACGTPVVAFRNSATEEVVGQGPGLVADGDVQAVADRVLVLQHPATRREAVDAGCVRASEFSWSACIAVHLAAFHRAVETG
jgi:glycosyltransferase involved in cell wall biosynthesis